RRSRVPQREAAPLWEARAATRPKDGPLDRPRGYPCCSAGPGAGSPASPDEVKSEDRNPKSEIGATKRSPMPPAEMAVSTLVRNRGHHRPVRTDPARRDPHPPPKIP